MLTPQLHDYLNSPTNRTVAVSNQKGGVGKTTVAAALASRLAADGPVLLVEVETQASLIREFGVAPSDTDGGRGLVRAVIDGEALRPLRQVRTNIDLVAGGPALEQMYRTLASGPDGFPQSHLLAEALQRAVAEQGYHHVVIDTAPGDAPGLMASLLAARYVVTPTRPDIASLDGLSAVVNRLVTLQQRYDKSTVLLGVVLLGIARRATKVLSQTEAEIARRSDGLLKVYQPPLRDAQAAATAVRSHGLLFGELVNAASMQREDFEGRFGKGWWRKAPPDERRQQLPDAAGIAADLAQVCDAIAADLADDLAKGGNQ